MCYMAIVHRRRFINIRNNYHPEAIATESDWVQIQGYTLNEYLVLYHYASVLSVISFNSLCVIFVY